MTPIAITITPVNPTHSEVVQLIEELNQYQIALYGRSKCTLESPQDLIKNEAYMVGASYNDKIIGIGAIKLLKNYAELKRMFIHQDFRKHGIANKTLSNLEDYALSNNINTVKLETGTAHIAAKKFYLKNGYTLTKRFGKYPKNDISVFMEKNLL